MKSFKVITVLFVFVFGLRVLVADAQDFEVKQRLVEFPAGSISAVLGMKTINPQELKSVSEKLFAQPVEALTQKAGNIGAMPEVSDNVFYISEQKMRVDITGAEGKMTGIMRLDERKIYNVMWASKQYTELSMDSMKQMQQQASEALKKMPSMEEALEKMPPEVRAQMQAHLGGSAAQRQEIKVTKTGRTETVNGFECEEYRADTTTLAAQLFVTQKYPEVRQSFDVWMKEFGGFHELAGEAGMQDVFDKIPNGFPVLVKELKLDSFGMEPSYQVTEIVSVTEMQLPADAFQVPAGFSRVALPAQ